MITRLRICTLLSTCSLTSMTWGQAAMPLPGPQSEPSPIDTSAPANADARAPLPPAQDSASAAPGEPASTPAASPATLAPSPLLQPSTVTVANRPGEESPYVTTVGKQRSPREAVFLGIGIGGGRMQDKVTGFGGYAFNLDAGYSVTPELAIVLAFDGLVHPQGGGGDSKNEDDKRESAALWHYGGALGAQLHVINRLRFSLGVGYYALTHTAAKDSNGDSMGESRTLTSLGGEAAAGVEFFQSPGGFSAGIDFRTQLTFPDQKMVAATFGLIGVRWYGIGARRG